MTGPPWPRLMRRFVSVSKHWPVGLNWKSRLKQLHGEGLQACAEECERLRLLLLNHLEHAEGRAAYQRIDMFQAGDRG